MKSEDNLAVVLVDDEEDILFGASYMLNSHGIQSVTTLSDGRELMPFLQTEKVGAVVLDLFMHHISGTELLPQLGQHHPEVPVIVMTASQEVDTAVSCMKDGAFDYLVKPVEENRFVSSIRHAMEMRELRQQISSLRHSLITNGLTHPECFAHIFTRHQDMLTLFKYIEAVAHTREPVIITGESGTGKELIAQALHQVSGRSGELVCLNVAGLDDNIFSDTLFGHVKGAFTSATQSRDGMVAKAVDGTLFLDEIGDLSMTSQVKLLRLLQNHTYYPLGSDISRISSARIVVATNQNLHDKMLRGEFPEVLFFRLSSHPMNLPPLRNRLCDLPLLLQHFTAEASQALHKAEPALPDELFTLLAVYDFPGNIRELRSLVFNAVAQHQAGMVLSMQSFRDYIQKERRIPAVGNLHSGGIVKPSLAVTGRFPTLREADSYLIDEAMRRAKNNQGVAATLLGITRQSLNRRLINMATNKGPGT